MSCLASPAALMVLVSLVLAAACANVAGIMLTRATARAREIALRAALGAGRGRLVRQLLTETIVLFLFSGLLGIGLARVLMHLAMLMLPPLPASIVVPLTLDWRVLLFALSLSIGAAVVFGVLPAFRGSKRGRGRHRSRTACGHLPGARGSGALSLSARSRAVSCSSCSERRSSACCAMPAPPIPVSMRGASTSRRSTRRWPGSRRPGRPHSGGR